MTTASAHTEGRAAFAVALLVVSALAMAAGCAQDTNEIRVRNLTGFEIERLEIEGVDLGPVSVGEVSEYFGVEAAYEGMGFEAVIDGIPFSNTITDRDGALFLGSGRHTYELLYLEREDRDPALALVADR